MPKKKLVFHDEDGADVKEPHTSHAQLAPLQPTPARAQPKPNVERSPDKDAHRKKKPAELSAAETVALSNSSTHGSKSATAKPGDLKPSLREGARAALDDAAAESKAEDDVLAEHKEPQPEHLVPAGVPATAEEHIAVPDGSDLNPVAVTQIGSSIAAGSGDAAMAAHGAAGAPTAAGSSPQPEPPTQAGGATTAPSGMQGTGSNDLALAPGEAKQAIHKVAAERLSSEKGVSFAVYLSAYKKEHAAELNKISDAELCQSSVDLFDQGIDTVKVKQPRYRSGRANLLREFAELNVLYNMAQPTPEEASGGARSKLGMLLDMAGMGINDTNTLLAVMGRMGGGGGGGGGDTQGVSLTADGAAHKSGAAQGSAAALTQQEQAKSSASDPMTMGTAKPSALTVERTAEYTSTTQHGKRIGREFIMDRRMFDMNFSHDSPITDSTFHFKTKPAEKKKTIRF